MTLRLHRAVPLIVAAALAGCEALGLDSEADETRDQLIRHRELWAGHGYSDYSYTLERLCFCVLHSPISIDVAGGEVVAARYANGSGVLGQEALSSLPTVEGLFRIIEEALADRVDALHVTYHRTLGYPESISIDRRFGTADDEISYGASGLTRAGH
jgi:hypothetical protein